MRARAGSTVVTVSPYELAVSPQHVARYAGGARYRMDHAQRQFIGAVLKRAELLVRPAFVYAVHEVTGFLEEGFVQLSNGLAFPAPPGEQDAGIRHLTFCVCTIGPRLEEAVRALMAAGETLDGLFLDAAGVAFLEALSARAYETLQKQAKARMLYAGCRFGPGCGEVVLSLQKQLFNLVDASSLGVRLNDAWVMSPAKSLSFFVGLTTSEISQSSRNKCGTCGLTDCPYRISDPAGAHV
jgi:hypothetical protein